MNIKFLILINLITILLSSGQFNFQADGELLEYQEEGITINKLTQNVEVFNDSLYLKTDQAYNYKELNKLHLYGNTQMISNADTLTCDSMIYWMKKDSLFAYGGVTLKQVDSKLNSQTLNLPSGKILKGKERENFEVVKIKLDVLKSELILGLK